MIFICLSSRRQWGLRLRRIVLVDDAVRDDLESKNQSRKSMVWRGYSAVAATVTVLALANDFLYVHHGV